MPSPDAALQGWFKKLPMAVRRDLAAKIKDEADNLAEAIKSETPVATGALRDSIKVRRRRKSLEFEVVAGGASTTKEVRAGSGEDYDYSLAVEFGTADRSAEPFFYPTFRAEQAGIRERLEEAVQEAIENA